MYYVRNNYTITDYHKPVERSLTPIHRQPATCICTLTTLFPENFFRRYTERRKQKTIALFEIKTNENEGGGTAINHI